MADLDLYIYRYVYIYKYIVHIFAACEVAVTDQLARTTLMEPLFYRKR